MIKYLNFKKAKRFSLEQVIPALQKAKFFDKAEYLLHCGSISKFAMCLDCNTAHYAGSISCCRDKFCPVCQKKRSLLWLSKLIPICNNLLERGYHLNMLTYTIRVSNGMSLKDCITILQNSFRYMTNGWKQSAEKYNELILGGVRSLEIKIGEDRETKELTGRWHPHFHILVCTHGNIKYKDLHKILFELWNKSIQKVTSSKEEFCGSVNIRSIKPQDNQSLCDALSEVVKYMTKFDWQSDRVYELVTTLHKVRMQNTFGNFKYLISDAQIEKDMNKSYTEVAETFCSVCGGNNFVEGEIFGYSNLQLYDLQHKQSDYLNLKEDDLILGEIEE